MRDLVLVRQVAAAAGDPYDTPEEQVAFLVALSMLCGGDRYFDSHSGEWLVRKDIADRYLAASETGNWMPNLTGLLPVPLDLADDLSRPVTIRTDPPAEAEWAGEWPAGWQEVGITDADGFTGILDTPGTVVSPRMWERITGFSAADVQRAMDAAIRDRAR